MAEFSKNDRRNSGGGSRGNGGSRGGRGGSPRGFGGAGGRSGGRPNSRNGGPSRWGNGRSGGSRFSHDRDGEPRFGDGDRRSNNRRDDRRSNDRRDDRRRDDRHSGHGGKGGNGKFRSNRGGANRDGVSRARHSGPQRAGYREERINNRINEPKVPEDINPKDLDPSVRQELRSLSKDNADMVAKHLIMTALLLDDEPEKALEHARAAKDRAGRVAVARETCGIAAYHCGEWKEAISELRAARRMSSGPGLLPVLADAERGLGRPEKALEVARDEQADALDPESKVELAIVVAGAHTDLGQTDKALTALESQLGNEEAPEVSRMRLRYAYADAIAEQGRKDEAIVQFQLANELDTESMMDCEERIEALKADTTGEQLFLSSDGETGQ